MNDTNVSRFFSSQNTNLLHYWVRTDESEELIHKGDFVHYNGHISTVYSDRWGESRYSSTLGTMYDVIHAYGISSYDEGIPGHPPIFSRKVLTTGSNISNPTGFGRIKLWE